MSTGTGSRPRPPGSRRVSRRRQASRCQLCDYFHENLIAEYSQEASVFDGVNVDQQLYRIRTEVGEHGSIIEGGEWVRVRDKLTRHVDVERWRSPG